jgi:hypothetical protein
MEKPKKPLTMINADVTKIYNYLEKLESYCDYLEKQLAICIKPVEFPKPKEVFCSIHPDIKALYISKTSNNYYCGTCASYIFQEYGVHCLKDI